MKLPKECIGAKVSKGHIQSVNVGSRRKVPVEHFTVASCAELWLCVPAAPTASKVEGEDT